MTKLFNGLAKRLISLLQVHEDLYFKERPWLENPTHQELGAGVNGEKKMLVKNTPHVIISYEKESKQVELEIEKTAKALNKLCNPVVPPTNETVRDLFGVLPS